MRSPFEISRGAGHCVLGISKNRVSSLRISLAYQRALVVLIFIRDYNSCVCVSLTFFFLRYLFIFVCSFVRIFFSFCISYTASARGKERRNLPASDRSALGARAAKIGCERRSHRAA